jgi:hypothetical protein
MGAIGAPSVSSAVEDRGWDWVRQAEVDPLLASFYRKA